ncbi:MAG: pyridoxamine 5'-phosphate oxidase family protein [Anaerolineales bacterium]|nr:pyridoxamine 5'-phosphate oxidase family protein [Anaerolineales bacterium]
MTTLNTPILTQSVRRFLASPRLARLCTIGKDGYPHVVPIYFARVGDDIIFGTDRDEAKVRNALRNSKSAIVIGGIPETDDAGYMIQGNLSVEHNPRPALVRKILRRYESNEEADRNLAEWVDSDKVLLRLRPVRVIRVW